MGHRRSEINDKGGKFSLAEALVAAVKAEMSFLRKLT